MYKGALYLFLSVFSFRFCLKGAEPSLPSSAVVKKAYSYTSIPPMGRTACTEPQCLYNGALPSSAVVKKE